MKKLFLAIFMLGMYRAPAIHGLTCDDIQQQHAILWHAMVEEVGGAFTNELLIERMSLEHQVLEEILNGCKSVPSYDVADLVFDENMTVNQKRIAIMRRNIEAFGKRKNAKRFACFNEYRQTLVNQSKKQIDELEENFETSAVQKEK